MARRVSVVLVDDLDGSAADRTVTFELDGHGYEIDLSTANEQALRVGLAPFVAAARPANESDAGTTWRRPARNAVTGAAVAGAVTVEPAPEAEVDAAPEAEVDAAPVEARVDPEAAGAGVADGTAADGTAVEAGADVAGRDTPADGEPASTPSASTEPATTAEPASPESASPESEEASAEEPVQPPSDGRPVVPPMRFSNPETHQATRLAAATRPGSLVEIFTHRA